MKQKHPSPLLPVDPNPQRRMFHQQVAQRVAYISQQYLLKDSTLESVANSYGLTRERIRQIIRHLYPERKRLAEIKTTLKYYQFRCKACGGSLFTEEAEIRPAYSTSYCSPQCHRLYNNYDLSHTVICNWCKLPFYPIRETIRKAKVKSCPNPPKHFCCVDHWIRYSYKRGLIGSYPAMFGRSGKYNRAIKILLAEQEAREQKSR